MSNHHGHPHAEHHHATKTNVRTFFDEKDTNTATYVMWCPVTRRAAIIDSVLDFDFSSGTISSTNADKVLAFVKQHQLHVDYILETHVHADHLTAAQYLKKKLDSHAKVCIGENVKEVQEIFKKKLNLPEDYCTPEDFDMLLKDGDRLDVGNLSVKVIHTPGHTPACVCFYVEDDCVFVGDTIFMPDQGTARCDFPGGSTEDLFHSIQKILHLPGSVHVFVGHDYAPGGREFRWQTSVSEEKGHNIFFTANSTLDKFAEVRRKRDSTLNVPRLLFPSIQVNLRAGKLPEPEENGMSYLKLPLTIKS
eukprot:TRINITY_DN6209_c0_g1_i1.p1 TRINITY_DN6209_c0_g1~~TRINITY_DN6209_c0_g1_i1.p1  ORF type:complete len:306 (+),score=58.67 TRINITY_DN6209_c0_g1_i1:169-1086(+)